MKRFLAISSLSYLLIGLAHVVVGSVLAEMMDHYGLLYRDGGTVVMLQFAGFLFGVLGAPRLVGRIGPRNALLIALLFLTAAEFVYSLLPSWPVVMGVAPFAGLGFGMVEAVIASAVIGASGAKSASYMARIEVFFGVGALLMPLFAVWFVSLGHFRFSFILMALLSFAVLGCWKFISFGDLDRSLSRPIPEEHDSDETSKAPYRRNELVLLALLILFFLLYVGMEMSLANFLPSLFIELFGTKQATASGTITLFWITMSIGRLYAGPLAEKISYARYLFVGSFGALLCLAGFIFADRPWQAVTLIAIAGLLMSGIFAIALVYANRLLPGRTHSITSLLIGAGGLGGALFPYVTGLSMDNLHADHTRWVLAGFACALTLSLAAIVQASRRKRGQTAQARS